MLNTHLMGEIEWSLKTGGLGVYIGIQNYCYKNEIIMLR